MAKVQRNNDPEKRIINYVESRLKRLNQNSSCKAEIKAREGLFYLVDGTIIDKKKESNCYYIVKDTQPEATLIILFIGSHATDADKKNFTASYGKSEKRRGNDNRFPKTPKYEQLDSEPNKKPYTQIILDKAKEKGYSRIINELLQRMFNCIIDFENGYIFHNNKRYTLSSNDIDHFILMDDNLRIRLPFDTKKYVHFCFQGDKLSSLNISLKEKENTSDSKYKFHIYFDYYKSMHEKKCTGIEVIYGEEYVIIYREMVSCRVRLLDGSFLEFKYYFSGISSDWGLIYPLANPNSLDCITNPDMKSILNSIGYLKPTEKGFIRFHDGENILRKMLMLSDMLLFSKEHKNAIIEVLSFLLNKPKEEIPDIFDAICSHFDQEIFNKFVGRRISLKNNNNENAHGYLRALFDDETSVNFSFPNCIKNYLMNKITLSNKERRVSLQYNPYDVFKLIVSSHFDNEDDIREKWLPGFNDDLYVVYPLSDDYHEIGKMVFNIKTNLVRFRICAKDVTNQNNKDELRFDVYYNNNIIGELTYEDALTVIQTILRSKEFYNYFGQILRELSLKNGITPTVAFRQIVSNVPDVIINEIWPNINELTNELDTTTTLDNATEELFKSVLDSIPVIERFQELSKLFGFNTFNRSCPSYRYDVNIIEISKKIGESYIHYRIGKDPYVYAFSIENINAGEFNNDMRFAIIYSESACRLSIQIPTYERLVDGSQYTSYSESYINIDPRDSRYHSYIYDGSVSLDNGKYIEQRPVVGKFSLPEYIAKHYKNYGYELCGKPGELGGFYKKELTFTPKGSQEFIRNILRSSKYLPCLIATLFQKLGCTETCDASEIFRLIVSLLPQQFVTDFFGSEEIYLNFLTRLEPENIRRALDQLQNRRDSGNSASNNPEPNYSTVQAGNLELLNGIPNLTYEIIDDEIHGHGIILSINNTESRQNAESQYSILFSDNVIDISCGDMKILVNLNIDNPQLEIDNTANVNYLHLESHNFTGKTGYDIHTTDHPLICTDIDNPIEYVKQHILSQYIFTSVLKETISKFLSFCNINMTVEQLLEILYASAPRMAAIIKDSDMQPLGRAMKMAQI